MTPEEWGDRIACRCYPGGHESNCERIVATRVIRSAIEAENEGCAEVAEAEYNSWPSPANQRLVDTIRARVKP
jgi:hypothetical protein